MKEIRKQHNPETFLMGAILAIVGGYLDAYTYISRGQVFANAQTGNIMLFSIHLASGNLLGALSYIPPILAFIIGIALSEYIKKRMDGGRILWQQYILLLELAIIITVSFLPQGSVYGIRYQTIANVLISFVCSLQVQSFRRFRGIFCATTMCTGNLRSGVEAMSKYASGKNKTDLRTALKFYAIVLFFIIGAVIGTLLTNLFMEKSVIFCAAGLVLAIILLFF